MTMLAARIAGAAAVLVVLLFAARRLFRLWQTRRAHRQAIAAERLEILRKVRAKQEQRLIEQRNSVENIPF